MTPFELATRFVGEVVELPGPIKNSAFIQWCHESVGLVDTADEVAWCSSFANRICWLLRITRSKSARARSWLTVGRSVTIEEATPGFDIVILKRGTGAQPGPDVIDAPGHVGFFAGTDGTFVTILGGNQSDGVTVARFPKTSVLGIRRLVG